MTARSNFGRTMGRVDGLIDLNRRLSSQGRPPRENSDILRAATVLSLGALDALVVDAIVESCSSASKKGQLGDRVATWLEKDGLRCLEMLAHADPHKEIARFVAERLEGVTLQRTAMIDDNLKAILGSPPPWSVAAKRIGGEMTDVNLKFHMNHFSDRRNQIAHKGDIKSGTQAAESITREWVERHVGYVRIVGETISDELNALFGAKRGRKPGKLKPK